MLSNPIYSHSINGLLNAFQQETSKSGIAASNAFVLVEWGSEFIQQCAAQEKFWIDHGLNIVLQQAQILERCLSSNARGSVKQSALVVTRRALRKLFRTSHAGETAVKEIVTRLAAKSHGVGANNAVLLGVVAGVCARLDSRRPILETVKGLYYSFYVREIVGSRSPVPQHIVTAYNDFFASFTTQEDLQKEIVPALEKALLRAPEVVLNDLISYMMRSLRSSIDASQALADHLLKPFLANLKSQNPTIRNGVISAFNSCLNRCHEDKYLQKITDDILNPLATSKLNVAEQRSLYSKMLSLLPFSVAYSALICTSLAALVAKEPNEAVLAIEIAALAQHLSPLLSAVGEDTQNEVVPVINAFSKGLNDKRPAARKAWILKTGDVLWHLKIQPTNTRLIVNFIDVVAPKLWDCYTEIIANLHASALSGLAVAAYVVVAVDDFIIAHTGNEQVKARGRGLKIQDQPHDAGQKSSIFNHRIYTKLADDEEMRWAIRTLSVNKLLHGSRPPTLSFQDDWALMFLYFVTATNVSPSLRQEAVNALQSVYSLQPRVVAPLIIRALWIWLSQLEHSDKDAPATAAKTGNSNLHVAVRAIFPAAAESPSSLDSIDVDILRSQLIDIIVLARPDITPKVNWIDLCLRVGQDPGDIARLNAGKILQMLATNHSSANITLASYKAAAELAFVSPEVITPKLTQQILEDLSAESVSKCGPTEVAIARTPEGSAFIDVLDSKTPEITIDKNSRDYETLKWEAEVRKQQARKKGQEKKLTADEKAKVDSQLLKEAKIRQEVQQIEQNLRRGIGLVYALATGPPTEAALWMRQSLEALLKIIAAGAAYMVGNQANEAYLACSKLVSSRLGSLRPFIGVATLRSLASIELPKHLMQEPLGGM